MPYMSQARAKIGIFGLKIGFLAIIQTKRVQILSFSDTMEWQSRQTLCTNGVLIDLELHFLLTIIITGQSTGILYGPNYEAVARSISIPA